MDVSAVYRRLSRAGAAIRSSGDWCRLDLDIDEIRHLHQEGVRATQIAKRLGVSRSAVTTRIREMGLTPHPPGRPRTSSS